MFDRNSKGWKNIEISLGLLVGYCIGAMINMWAFGKSYDEAFLDEKLVLGIAGIGLTLFMIYRKKEKSIEE